MPGLTSSELKRKIVHIAVGGFAFLLRDLTWPQAALMATTAFLFNWLLLPRIGGRGLWRTSEHAKGYPLGILLYPLSVLALVLLFREDLAMAAAVWGVMAFGDGMASLLGQTLGGPRLPWNARKGWFGLLAFILFGTLGVSVLFGWTLRVPWQAWGSGWILGLALPLCVLCALVESAPTTLDDNLTVPLVGAVVLPLLAQAEVHRLLTHPELGRRVILGLAINAAIAALARAAGSIDVPGAVSAVIIGTTITAGVGFAAFGLMVAFFVIGSAATRLGYRVKTARGIAQERGGARGWRNAWANGGVPAFLALMAGVSPEEMRAVLAFAYAASVATAAADTCSSEVGKAYGRRTFLITTLRPVPPGTEGAVSLEGTLAGLCGGLLVASVGALSGLYSFSAPHSWVMAAVVALAGLLGSLAESVVGTVAERKGWMNNDLLNAFNTAVGAGIVVLFIHVVGLPYGSVGTDTLILIDRHP